MLIHVVSAFAGLAAVNQFLKHQSGQSAWGSLASMTISVALLLILGAYALVRLGLYRTGLAVYILVTAATALVAGFSGDPPGSIAMLTTASISVLVTTMLLSYRWVFGVLVAILVAAIVMLGMIELPPGQTAAGSILIGILVVTSGLIVVLRHHLATLERMRTEQLRQSQEAKLLLEQKMQQAAKMESVGQLASGVAHDFNNLLTAILGNLDLARVNFEDPQRAIEALDEVEQAANSATALTRQLLAFTRQHVVDPKIIDVNEVIARVERMLVRLIGEDVVLRSVAGPDLWRVKADPVLIEQIVINLAVNARDAMPEGGSLLIETSNVTLESSYQRSHPDVTPGDYLLLAVTDTGAGMPPEVKARLFEPFFTTKPKGRGTGLGLATTYGAVTQCGGHIEVYSEPSQGTSFKVYLPRSNEALHAQEGAPEPVRRGSATVLFVEDDAEVRDMGVRLLEALGYRVLRAAGGAEAVEIAEHHPQPIHLLLTDVVMPGMNGRELSTAIIALHPETKILYASGYCENIIAHRGVLDGEVAFLAKPYGLRSLSAKLREVLGDPVG